MAGYYDKSGVYQEEEDVPDNLRTAYKQAKSNYNIAEKTGNLELTANALGKVETLRNQISSAASPYSTTSAVQGSTNASGATAGTSAVSGSSGNGIKYNYDTYDDFKNNGGYDAISAANKAATAAYIKQGTAALNSQKQKINQDSETLSRQAYLNYMQSNKNLPQQLSSNGYASGMADSMKVGLNSNYQNNQNSIQQNRADKLYDIDSNITNMVNSGNLEAAKAEVASAQNAVNAWNNYMGQINGYGFEANENALGRNATASENALSRNATASENALSRSATASENQLNRAQDQSQYDTTMKFNESEAAREQQNIEWQQKKDNDNTEYERQFNKWKTTGVLDEGGAAYFGLKTGTPTSDYHFADADNVLNNKEYDLKETSTKDAKTAADKQARQEDFVFLRNLAYDDLERGKITEDQFNKKIELLANKYPEFYL
jgi:hypothetical protein